MPKQARTSTAQSAATLPQADGQQGEDEPSKRRRSAPPQFGGDRANAAAAANIRPEDAASLGDNPRLPEDGVSRRASQRSQQQDEDELADDDSATTESLRRSMSGVERAEDTGRSAAGDSGDEDSRWMTARELRLVRQLAKAEAMNELLMNQAQNRPNREDSGERHQAASGSALPSDPDKLILVKTAKEPPDEATQKALWAAAKDTAPTMSPEEKEHRASFSTDMTPEERTLFQHKLMQIMLDHPRAPAMKYLGRFISPSTSLAADVPLPQVHNSWQAYISVRQFRQNDGLSLADVERHYGRQSALQIGGAEKFTAVFNSAASSAKLPDLPANAGEYGPMAERHLQFMLATGRWTHAEEAMVRKHIAYVVDLFNNYPASDVTMYDENVRFLNDKYQTANWGRNATQLAHCIYAPAARRALLARSKVSAASADRDPYKPYQPPEYVRRPWDKHQSHNKNTICRKWNWEIGECTDENCVHPSKLEHVCSFCTGPHRVKDCDSYKQAHPDDHAKGWTVGKKNRMQGGRGRGRGGGRGRGRN